MNVRPEMPSAHMDISCGDANIHPRLRTAGVLFGALLLVAAATRAWSGQADDLVLVVNASGPFTTLTAQDARPIFLGNVHIVSDVSIAPVRLTGAPEQAFASQVLNMTAHEFQVYWERKSFQDGVLPPTSRGTADEVLDYIRRDKGAIGFVRQESIHNLDGLRVVAKIPVPEGHE
jgi:ABC-type phosphate transport system substrate-binding protein